MTQLPSYLNEYIGPTPTPKMIADATPEKKDEGTPSFLDVFFNSTVTGPIIDWMHRPSEVDPDFKITPDLLKLHARDIPANFIDDIADSDSLEEFLYRTTTIKDKMKTQRQLSEMGATGMAYQFGVSMLDPVFLTAAPLASLAIGTKAVGAGVVATRTVRAQAAMRGFGISAAVDAPIEGLRWAVDPFTDGEDFVINTLASVALGTTLSTAFPRLAGFQKGWKDQVKLEKLRIAADIEKTNVDELIARIGPDGAEQIIATAKRRGIDVEGKETGQIFRELIAAEERTGPGTVGPFLSEEGTERYVNGLSKKELYAEAKARGIETTRRSEAGPDDQALSAIEERISKTDATTFKQMVDLRKSADELGIKTLDDAGKPKSNEALRTEIRERVGELRKKGNRKVPRTAKELREEIINARRKDFELDSQSATAIIKAIDDSDESIKNALNVLNFSVEDYAKELAKRIPEESIFSRTLNFIPGAKPLAIMAKRSQNERVRSFFSLLVEDPTGSPRIDVETIVYANRQVAMGNFQKARLAIKRSNGHKALEEFDANVAEAIRTGKNLDGLEGKAVSEIRKFFNGLAEYAEEAGIAGFREFVNNNYVPRRALASAVSAAIDKFGEVEVRNLLTKALTSNNPDMSSAKVKAIVNGWFKYAEDPTGYVNARISPKSEAHSAAKISSMRSVLEKEGIEPEAIEEILEYFIPKSRDPHLGMTNKRINFNEAAFIEVEGKGILKFSDLLENDMTLLMEQYATRLLGSAELTKLAKALNIPISGTEATVPTRGDMIRWLQGGEGGLDENMQTGFEVAYNAIMGMSQGNLNDKSRRALRFLQDLAFIQSMGNVGVAQLPELANSTVSNGLRATLQSVPRLRKLLRQAHNGELSDEVLAELDAFIRPGDMLDEGFTRTYRIHDDVGIDENGVAGTSRAMTGMRTVASGAPVTFGGRGITLNPLGIGPADELLRNGHVAATLQNWVNLAYKVKDGKKVANSFWSKSKKRFEYLGFSEEETDEILKALADPSVTVVEQGLLGKNIVKLNLSAMDNRLRNKLVFALRRDVDRVIQRNKVGNLSPWMNHPMGNVFLQFRKFAINATNKQLVYNLDMMDGKALATFVSTIGLGTIGYMITTEIGAQKYRGKELREYRDNAYGTKEYLGIKIPNLLIAGVIRSGPSGALPMVLSPLTKMIDPEEQDLFNTYRTSGYGVGFLNLENTPVGSLLTGGGKALMELGAAGLEAVSGGRVGNKLTNDELRSILRNVPLRNTILMNKALSELQEALDLPDKQR